MKTFLHAYDFQKILFNQTFELQTTCTYHLIVILFECLLGSDKPIINTTHIQYSNNLIVFQIEKVFTVL